jgi:hypothetical protein
MAGGGSSIPVRGRLGSAGKGWGSAQGLTYDRFRGWTAPRACRRGGSAAPASGGRCNRSSGEQDARPGTQATWGALGVQWEATGGCIGDSVVRKGELAMRPPMAVGGMRARGTVGCSIYNKAAPSLRLEAMTLHLPRSTTAILDLHAHETGDGPLGARRRYGATRAPTRRARVPRRQARRGTGCSCLEAVGSGPHGR